MRTDQILDSIDHALEDWSVGPDAMRWKPSQKPDNLIVTITADTRPFAAAFARLTEVLNASAPALENLSKALDALRVAEAEREKANLQHRIRSDYRRRSLARRRRK